jgi:predicted anti-sigma-YlaC factor YlaD
MAHNPYEVLISLSLDGLLDPTEAEELEQHLQTCEACADLRERMALVDVMFAAPPEVEPPPDFAAGVMARVQVYQTRRRWTPWLIAVLAIASVLGALSVAWPVAFFSLGLHEVLAALPGIGQILGQLLDIYGDVLAGANFIVDSIYGWLAFLIEDPAALAVVLSALVFASTWIGLLEGMKATRRAQAGAEA